MTTVNAGNVVNATSIVTPVPNVFLNGDLGALYAWQRNTTFADTVGVPSAGITYTADLWMFNTGTTGYATFKKAANAPTSAQAGYYTTSCMQMNTTSALTSLPSTNGHVILAQIEGIDLQGIYNQNVCVSFWSAHTVTGTHCVAFSNYNGNRGSSVYNNGHYVVEYTQAVSNTWQFNQIVVPASWTGTWNLAAGTLGASIIFPMYKTTENTGVAGWNSTAYNYCTANQVNNLGTIGNNYNIALLKVEPGTSATPWPYLFVNQHRSSLERYVEKSYAPGTVPGTATGQDGNEVFAVGASTNGNTCYFYYPFRTKKIIPASGVNCSLYNDITGTINSVVAYNNGGGTTNRTLNFGAGGLSNQMFFSLNNNSSELMCEFQYFAYCSLF